ncbi:MAG: hypothetical protein ACK4QL_11730 [Pseudanabaenaceae cyanobacterium]
MKNNPLIIFSLSTLILLGVNPIKAEDITPEIKTTSQLPQIQSAQLLSQQTSLPADDEIDITVTGTRTLRELLDTPGSITIIRSLEGKIY